MTIDSKGGFTVSPRAREAAADFMKFADSYRSTGLNFEGYLADSFARFEASLGVADLLEALQQARHDFADIGKLARDRRGDGDEMDRPSVWRLTLADISDEADEAISSIRAAISKALGTEGVGE